MNDKLRTTRQLVSSITVRAAASLTIADVLGVGRSLNSAIEHHSSNIADHRDLALLREIAYGVLRILPQLRHYVKKLMQRSSKLKDLELECLLLVGLYQLDVLRIPDHAAVSQTVAAARELGKAWACGFINAVLRNFIRNRHSYNASGVIKDHCFPTWLATSLQQAWPDDAANIMQASDCHPPMTLRVNLTRVSRATYIEYLRSAGLDAEPLEHAPAALRLTHPVDVTVLPGFMDGLVSIQDAAAQLAVPLLNITSGNEVLEACAAPGGKTAHLLECHPDIKLTAVDADTSRLAKLAPTLKRLGLTNPRILPADLTDTAPVASLGWMDRSYDRILLDAPCSATGVIRRHPDIKWLRQPKDILNLANTQRLILDNLWAKLNPGGILLYVTCSLLPEENYALIASFLRHNPDAYELPLTVAWGHACVVGRQILTGEHGMDGFYFARLVRSMEIAPP